MSKVRPPYLAEKLFKWYCNPHLQEQILGDLEEQFEDDLKHFGKAKAKRIFAWNVLRFCRPGIIKKIEGTDRLNNYGMLKNYFKVSVRSILRNKTFSLLNLSGLSVGIASCVLIFIYVHHELSYDTYNSKYDRTYRVLHYYGDAEAEPNYDKLPVNEYQVWGNAPVAPALQEYFPEIEQVFRFTSDAPWLLTYDDITFSETDILFADSTAFTTFDWNLIAGDSKTALVRPNTIVLSKQLAQKYFRDENPVGKTIIMDGEDPFEVTGVVEVPSNSHFTFNGLISMSTFRTRRAGIFTSWGYVDFYTYFTLKPGTDIKTVKAGIADFVNEKFPYDWNYTIAVEPMSDAYLNSEAGRQPGAVGSIQNIYIFSSVAIFILLIACINFMNLSTARSVERAKEVAIRKTIGSQRQSLIYQFLVEAIIIAFMAAGLAILFIILGHSALESLSGKSLPITWLFSPAIILGGLLSILLIGIIAGSYPAFVLSNFQPIKVLKGSFKNSSEGVWLRKSLVVLQFSLSILLLAGATVVSSQLSFLQDYDMGFDNEQMLVIDFGYDGKVQQKRALIKSQFLKHPDVEAVSVSRAAPGDFFPNAGTGVSDPNSGEIVYKSPAIYEVDEAFIPTYKMEMVAGRNFSDDFPLDSANALILNESAAKLYGYPNPADIIGKSFEQWGREGKVVGVVKDFNYVSLHQNVEPLSIRFGTRYNVSVFSVKLTSSNYSKTLMELENTWNDLVPHRPFDTRFVNQNFDKQYESDQRFGSIFSIFSGLAIFVACLGLFGLTIYSTTQRRKEIGVRKVLGASVSNLVGILSKDFILLFGIAMIIAVPVSWYGMNQWLDGFAYRINLGWQVYAIAGAITLVISLATMSFKTITTAMSNPIDSLRNE